ncbi:SRPBCC family protein [Kribbella sp. VKM Ac-2568]|uniref:SRPBCC family protein n=1 Tax=Kribbella sp. VKM Ac-2568 TaxID=2512219 RepID=UPI00104E1EC8|nr:SRPBCC family protein [Kribbella sp. VKM Ac-2568]TCM44256.1 carbon monoxide dehydrogenase subunit G [Kribbella sp. VKM Ac-2568]
MKLEHRFVVPVPVEQAWVAFNDLERVVPCFPGATLTSCDDVAFAGSCKVKLGPVALQYTGTGTFVERDPANHSAVLEAKGKDRRGNGTATARVTAQLTPTGDAATEVTVDTDLVITGRPAQFGRGLIQEVSDKLLDQFVDYLTVQLATPIEPASPAESASPAEPVSPAAPTPPTPPRPPTPSPGPAPSSEASLNLASTLLPAVAKRVAPYLIGAAVALLLRRLLRR